MFSGTGDCPRVVLAPTDTKSCYEATFLALYFAEKYQTLVVILLDFFLSNSIKNIDVPEKPDEKYLNANIAPTQEELKDYKRYKITETGISPRTIPGTPGGVFFATGLEHDENGRPNYTDAGHLAMTQKRFNKYNQVLTEAPLPEIADSGKKEYDIGVVSWGSSAGAAHEAVMTAQREGMNAASFSSMMLSPFPEKALAEFGAKCKQILIPELNFSGQFANFASQVLKRPVEKLNFISSRPMASEDILEKMREM